MTATILASIIALLASCNVDPPDGPDDKKPPTETEEGQGFCCTDINPNDLTGDGCVTISVEQYNSCSKVLYCPEAWVKIDGQVACK